MNLNATTGLISGTPTGPAGTSAFDARVTGNDGLSSTRALSILIVAAPVPAPGAFGKSTPANNAKQQPTNPTLGWSASSNATSYEYCYDTSNNATCNDTWRPAGTALSASISGLTRKTTYYWQVRATNSQGTTVANGGSWWKFTTVRN